MFRKDYELFLSSLRWLLYCFDCQLLPLLKKQMTYYCLYTIIQIKFSKLKIYSLIWGHYCVPEDIIILNTFLFGKTTLLFQKTRLRSAVCNVPDYRYASDCKSRGHKFDPSPVPFFRGRISTAILLISTDSFKKG